jgi:hypothetical protein
MNLTGPWTVQVHGRPYKFKMLTVIDTVTNLVRIEKRIQIMSCKCLHYVGKILTMASRIHT